MLAISSTRIDTAPYSSEETLSFNSEEQIKNFSPLSHVWVIPWLAQDRGISLPEENYRHCLTLAEGLIPEAHAIWGITTDNLLSKEECLEILASFKGTSVLESALFKIEGRPQALVFKEADLEVVLMNVKTLEAIVNLEINRTFDPVNVARAFSKVFNTPHWLCEVFRRISFFDVVNTARLLHRSPYHPLFILTSPICGELSEKTLLRFKKTTLFENFHKIYLPSIKAQVLQLYFDIDRKYFLRHLGFADNTSPSLFMLIQLNLILGANPMVKTREGLIKSAFQHFKPNIPCFFDYFEDEDLPYVFSLMTNADFFKRSFTVDSIPIEDNGRLENTWEELLCAFLNRIESFVVQEDPLPLPQLNRKVSMFTKWKLKKELKGYRPAGYAGRTEVLRKGDKFLFIKHRREDEPEEMLRREAVMNIAVRSNPSFRSKPPKPVGFWPNQFVYKALSIKPITYAHDPKVNFKHAQRRYMHDIGLLMRRGLVYTALADLFHNNEKGSDDRYDYGRYIPLAGLINDSFLGFGAGRLSGWKEAVRYPNVGLGLRDLADIERVCDLAKHRNPFFVKHFQTLLDRETEFTFPSNETLILSNAMAEALLIDLLVIGCREDGDWSNNEDCLRISQHVLEGAVQLLNGYTEKNEDELRAMLKSSGVNWKRLGMQMLFWMKNSEADYVPFIRNSIKLPEGLYESDAKVSVASPSEMRGWDDTLGFSINGYDADLGTVNGPFPIVEAVKVWYLTVMWMHALRKLDL